MLWTILIIVAVLIGLFFIIVAMQPSEFTVSRSAVMSAPPARVFEQVNDFHNWNDWSPWAKLDPNMTETHEGPPSGVGAVYSWVGNKAVGEGRMKILESRPSEYIRIKLEFLKPFKATNNTEFTFKPQGNQTQVLWHMTGHNGCVLKAFCLFMNMDKMIGKDFEKGLVQMKSLVESNAA